MHNTSLHLRPSRPQPIRWNRAAALLPLLLLLPTLAARGQAPPGALDAFHRYCAGVETRLARQHATAAGFLADTPAPGSASEPFLEHLTPAPDAVPPGALLHHWRATAFLPGGTRAALEGLLRDLPAYPRVFAPEVLRVQVFLSTPASAQATLRLRQKHILTVVLDTTSDITVGQLDAAHGFLLSRSTRVAEIADAGTPDEHVLPPAEERGFLWAQNTYWSYAERPGGLEVQVESVSLSRAIPAGLGWAVRPFAESVPRESLRFTLTRAAEALAAAPNDQLRTSAASSHALPTRAAETPAAQPERTRR